MILELFDYQFIIICYKSDAKLQKNIQTTKYQFFTHKKVASSDICLTTYDLLLIVYKRLFCCTFETFHHREDEQS
jgi:hypothetical protein